MAKDKVEVTLRRSVGLRRAGAERAVHYGPGKVTMPAEDARALGIVDAQGNLTAKFQPEGERTAKGGRRKQQQPQDYESMKVDELQALAQERELDVQRGDGQDGDPLKGDYVKALQQSDG